MASRVPNSPREKERPPLSIKRDLIATRIELYYTLGTLASNARFHYRFTWITIHIWFLSPWNFIGKHADAKLIKHLNRRRSYGSRGGVEKAIEASRLPFCFLNSIGRERCPISKIASPIMQYFKQSWNVSVIPTVGEEVAAVRTDDPVDYCRRIICGEFARNAFIGANYFRFQIGFKVQA